MEVFDEHQGGQLRIGAPGDPLELLPLSDAGIPDVGHVLSPAENELERRAVAKLTDEQLQPYVDGIMGYPEAARKVIAREANKRAGIRRQGGALGELEGSLRRAPELTGEAFKACVIARNLVDDGALELSPDTLELLERERHYGRAIDAHEAARAVRAELDAQEAWRPDTSELERHAQYER